MNLPPTTTAEDDLKTYGQRRINLIWEVSQALIAMAITAASIFSLGSEQIMGNAFFLVIGFYFGRTNHARVGDHRGTST